MKSIRQVWRQPTRWILGIILIALSVAVLCICLGQSFSAGVAREGLEGRFITLAFPSDTYSAEADEWALQYAAEHSDIVSDVTRSGLASAYIEELVADNYTDYLHYDNFSGYPYKPYDRVVFEVTLESITPAVQDGGSITVDGGADLREQVTFEGLRVGLVGRIERVLALQEQYSDPTGFTARMTLEVADEAELEALGLEVGGRYLVFGSSYVDDDYLLRNYLSQKKNMDLVEAFEHKHFQRRGSLARISYGHLFTAISGPQLDQYRSVSFNVTNLAGGYYVAYEYDENGNPCADTSKSFTNLDGTLTTYTREEYAEKYGNLLMTRVSGSVEELLASKAGEEWRSLIEDLSVSYHSFPVVEAESLSALTPFARGDAKIVSGEDFTEEQIASGEKVCLISETVALLNGISVGDKISLSFYEKNTELPEESVLRDGDSGANPPAAIYHGETTPLGESEVFTVVGLYRKAEEWSVADFDVYGFTPNTVFIPVGATESKMEYGHRGLFRSFVIKNGRLEEFAMAVSSAGFDEQLLFDDNGYAEIEAGLENYDDTADRIVPLGFVVWGVVTVLFLLLYPMRQGRELDTMDSLGCTRWQRITHTAVSSAAILIPGTLVGFGAGMLLWESVVGLLTTSAVGSSLKIEMDLRYFVLVAAIQLVLSLIAVVAVSIPLTRTRGLDRRK